MIDLDTYATLLESETKDLQEGLEVCIGTSNELLSKVEELETLTTYQAQTLCAQEIALGEKDAQLLEMSHRMATLEARINREVDEPK